MATITAQTPATIETAKGSHTGTVQTCCEWQAEQQGSFASIEAAGVSVDVDSIDFDVDSIDPAIAECCRLIAAEVAAARG